MLAHRLRRWLAQSPPPPPTHFVWEMPRLRRLSLKFPLRFFNRMTHESRHGAIQFVGYAAVLKIAYADVHMMTSAADAV